MEILLKDSVRSEHLVFIQMHLGHLPTCALQPAPESTCISPPSHRGAGSSASVWLRVLQGQAENPEEMKAHSTCRLGTSYSKLPTTWQKTQIFTIYDRAERLWKYVCVFLPSTLQLQFNIQLFFSMSSSHVFEKKKKGHLSMWASG